MKKLLFLLLTVGFLTSVNAQDRRGQLWIGLSADLTGSSLLYASISPTLLYFLNDRVAIGGAASWHKFDGEEHGDLTASGRFYLTKNLFAEGGFSSDFNGRNGYLAGVGITSFWGSRVYIEPKFSYQATNDFRDVQGVNLSLGVGIKI